MNYFGKSLIVAFVMLLFIQAESQNSYSILFNSGQDEYAKFVCNDHNNNNQIVLTYKECFYSEDTSCVNKRTIYSITENGDTIQWPFMDRRNDTIFDVGSIFTDNIGEYFVIGTGWTEDSLGFPENPFDFLIKYDTDLYIIWEKHQNLPEQLHHKFRGSSNYHLVKLINGNLLIGKTVTTINPLFMWNYLIEVKLSNGSLIKHMLFPYRLGYMQGLTYTVDSLQLILHTDHTYLRECDKNTVGAITLDTVVFDTIRSYCYPRDDDPITKKNCPHIPYNAMLYGDGSLLVAGTGACTNLQTTEWEDYLFIYKYDSAFNILDSTFLTNKDTLYDASWLESLDINTSGEICIVGNHNRHIGPWTTKYSWIYLVKLDENLDIISERYIGGDAYYVAYSMVATDDGGIVVSGSRYDYLQNGQERDAFIIKTDGGLWVTTNENYNIPIHSALVYPNPGDESFTFRTTEYPSTLVVMDVSGQKLIQQRINKRETLIFTNNLRPGFFTWQLVSEQGQQIDTGKWVKIKN